MGTKKKLRELALAIEVQDLARILLIIHQQGEQIMSAIDNLAAAAARIEAEAGQTGAIVETLRASVAALQDQVAQGQVDTAAVEAIAAQLSAAADTLDSQGNDPAVAPEEVPAEVPADVPADAPVEPF